MERYPKLTLQQFKGLNDSLYRTGKPIEFAETATNVFFPLAGGIKTFGGKRQYNTTPIDGIIGIGDYTKTNEILVADNTGHIARLNGTGGFTTLASGKGTTNIYDTIHFNKRLYFFNGIDTPFYYDGTSIHNTGLAKGSMVEVVWDRLCYAGVSGSEDTVYLSGVFDDSVTDQYYAFPDKVTGLAVLGNYLVVFTRRNIYLLIPYGNIFKVEKIDSSVGCVGNGTIQKIEGGIIFLSEKGFYLFTGTTPIPISVGYLDENFKIFNLSRAKKFISAIDQKNFLYLCSVCLGSDSENSITYVWNYVTKQWSILAEGYSYLKDIVMVDNQSQVIGGTSDGYLYYEDTSDIPNREADWRSGWLRGSSLSDLTRWNFLYLYLADIRVSTELNIKFYENWIDTIVRNEVRNLTPDGALWGSFIWGDATWGGSSQIITLRIPINFISRSLGVEITGKDFRISAIEVSYRPLGGGV